MKSRIIYTLPSFILMLFTLFLLNCGDEGSEQPGEEITNLDDIPFTEKMHLSVTITESVRTVKLPFTGTVDCLIDWGDANDLEKASQPHPTHTYNKAGDYLIMVYGTVTELNSSDLDEDELSLLSGILCWGNTGLTGMHSAFKGCTELTYLAGGYETYPFADVISFQDAFSGCESLKEIPDELFDNCTKADDFASTFQNCTGLTQIPAGLFDDCRLISNLTLTFLNCKNVTGESPYTIVDGVKVHLYERIGDIGGFFEPQLTYLCFYGCTGLSDFANIPDGWK